jgi:4-amino-4-deoxychorismate lyase
MTEVVLVNGFRGDMLSPLDRGLHFGDGLFETIACVSGRPRFLTWHLERLAAGCQRLKIELHGFDDIRAEVRELTRDVDRAIVKVIVSRGVAIARGYARTGSERATRITVRYPWPHEDAGQLHDGAVVRTLTTRLGENPLLAGLKHCNRLEQVLARQEWSEYGDIQEGILFSASGKLACGTMSNVFLVRDAGLLTPRMDLCGVSGVMRRAVLDQARRAGIPAKECVLHAEDLLAAEELFLTNALIGIRPVRILDDRLMGPGLLTRRMREIMAPLLNEPADD